MSRAGGAVPGPDPRTTTLANLRDRGAGAPLEKDDRRRLLREALATSPAFRRERLEAVLAIPELDRDDLLFALVGLAARRDSLWPPLFTHPAADDEFFADAWVLRDARVLDAFVEMRLLEAAPLIGHLARLRHHFSSYPIGLESWDLPVLAARWRPRPLEGLEVVERLGDSWSGDVESLLSAAIALVD